MTSGGIGTLDPPEEASPMLQLIDLPFEVLWSIMGRVDDVVDLGSLLCTCRVFRSLARVVPFSIKLCRSKYAPSSKLWTKAVLKSIRSHMPSTKVLDLAGTWIADDDVAAVLADLKCLECLILDGCQKLTSSVADELAVSVRSGPRTLSLQRCFGIGPTAAGNLLAAAAVSGSRLQCILFSHLDRLDIPRDSPLLETEGEKYKEATQGFDLLKLNMSLSTGAGLRVLALNNCASLGLFELISVAITCPLLEILMLGGSVEALGLSRPDNVSDERTLTASSALVRAVNHLLRLHVLEVTFFTSNVVQFARKSVRNGVEVWDFCHKSSVMAALSYLDACKSGRSTRSKWPRVYSQNEDIMDTSTGSSPISGDIRESHSSHGVDSPTMICQDEKEKSNFCREDVVFAVHAAANCSDMRRRTPLHVAAASGDSQTVQSLLAIGAQAQGMKDSGGATALFVAAECGYANICELLLQGGADVLACNRAGENPLYIAALRGHCAAVEVLVSHCCKNAIKWQSAEAYGDGWTPLMAAAVADRQDVATILLRAANINLSSHLDANFLKDKGSCIHSDKIDNAGFYTANMLKILQEHQFIYRNPQNNSEWNPHIQSPIQLLDAQNRYGQTALHIAARRASIWFVCNLLIAGASMDIRDGYMMRAIDVAYHHNHKVVANIIKNWEAIQRNGELFAIQPALFTSLRSKDKQSGNDVSNFSLGWQSNKHGTTLEVQRAKQNSATMSRGNVANHGKSIVTQRYWRVKGGQRGRVPHAGSSSSL